MIARAAQWVRDKLAGKPTRASDGSARSSHWPVVRKQHLQKEPKCKWCGDAVGLLEVHHIAPFHLHPELELLDTNLITLCENAGKECHFHIGHNGTSWKDFNPNVRSDCANHKFTGLSQAPATKIKR